MSGFNEVRSDALQKILSATHLDSEYPWPIALVGRRMGASGLIGPPVQPRVKKSNKC